MYYPFSNYIWCISAFLSVKDQDLFHRVNVIGNIFTNGAAAPPVKIQVGFFKKEARRGQHH